MIHPVKIGGENGRFTSAGAGANLDDRVAIFVFIRGQQRNLDFALQVVDSLFQVGDFVIGHRGDLDIARSGQLAIIIELFPRRFELVPFGHQLFDAGVFSHQFARPFPIGKKRRISHIAFELPEALTFLFNERIKVHDRL